MHYKYTRKRPNGLSTTIQYGRKKRRKHIMVGRFEDIANTLENGAEATPENVKISLVTMDSVQNYTIDEGTTVAEFKRANDLVGRRLSDEYSNLLRDTDIFEEDMEIFVSTAKKNGKIFIKVVKA